MAEGGETPGEGDMVDGRRSLLMGSEFEFDFTCHPCDSGGKKNVEAEGYCTDCCVHLCATCISYHKMLPALVHHQLLDKTTMPSNHDNHPPASLDTCTERCPNHKAEITKYYCPDHHALGCTVCVTLKHKLCEDVKYIPEEVVGLEASEEYRGFVTRMEGLIQRSKETVSFSKNSLAITDENYKKLLKDLDDYRQEINADLDKLRDDITRRAKIITSKDSNNMTSVSNEGNKILKELESMSTNIQSHISNKKYCQTFIQMKKTEGKLTELAEKLENLGGGFASSYKFKRNPELRQLFAEPDRFGELVVCNPCDISVSHVEDLEMKSGTSSRSCYISGVSMLTPSRLVAVDWNNSVVKLIDTNYNNNILNEFITEASPWHVTSVDKDRVAVTLPKAKKILILKMDGRQGLLVKDKEIKVREECWGIAYIQDKLVVSYNNLPAIKLISMTGQVLQTFKTSLTGASYIAASPFNDCIYVSDWKQKCVTMFDMAGKAKVIYTDPELTNPRHLTTDNVGMVYLCDGDSHSMHLLTPDCRKVRVLLREKDGLSDPQSLCYCKATGRLYTGLWYNSMVKVYQLT